MWSGGGKLQALEHDIVAWGRQTLWSPLDEGSERSPATILWGIVASN